MRLWSTAKDIKEARKRAKWTQRELAARSGIHVSTVKYWEATQRMIYGWAVSRIKEAFETANMRLRLPLADWPSATSKTHRARMNGCFWRRFRKQWQAA